MTSETEDLELQYSPSRWAKRLCADTIVDHHMQVGLEASVKAKSKFDHELDVEYYAEDKVCVDIFKPKDVTPDAPVFIFIYGGYWQLACVNDGTHFAVPLINAGNILVNAKYTIAPEGTLKQMVNQIRQCVVFIAKRYPESRGIFLSGHSAGGHLAAMCLPVDWTKFNVKQDIIKGMFLLSGVFDVTPLVHTSDNQALKLTEAGAKAVSPVTYMKEMYSFSKHCKIIVALGEHDPPAFFQQSKAFSQQLEDGGVSAKFILVPGKDHFNIVHAMAEEDFSLTQELLKLIATATKTTENGFQ